MKLVETIIVGERSIFCDGLASTLRGSRFRICGEFSATKLIAEVERPCPGRSAPVRRARLCIVVDLAGCRGATEQVIAAVHRANPDACIVMISASGHDLEWAFEAGVNGCLPCTMSPPTLVLALDLLICREVVLRTRMRQLEPIAPEPQPVVPATTLGDALPVGLAPFQPIQCGTLSSRQSEILRSVALGQSNKHIARRLGIKEATVKGHVRVLLRKIGASNRTQAAVWVHRNQDNLPPFTGSSRAANGIYA